MADSSFAGRVGRVIYGGVLVLLGLALTIPGCRLLSLGGSAYYVVAGLATIAAGLLLIRNHRSGALVYCAMLVGTIAWALWEVGLDGWGLVPRIVAPIILGIPLFIAMLSWRFSARVTAAICAAVAVLCLGGYGILLAKERPDQPSSGEVLAAASQGNIDWQYYGMGSGGDRHSPAAQITPANVQKLQVAWSTHIDQPMNGLGKARTEGTPLKVDDTLYICTGLNDILALDAQTGKVKWRHFSHSNGKLAANGVCRGLAYYKRLNGVGVCAQSIYTATIDARLIAVDALTGAGCPQFGDNGVISLLKGVGQTIPGYYYVTSPPQVIRGKLVVNAFVADGQHTGEPSGVIRAFDATTGKFAWAWDMGNPNFHGEPADGKTYTLGTPNSWAPMSADENLGIVYVPTGNATPDYFGAHRTPVMEKYSTSVVAIDAETGAEKWHFQMVHHDIWDYDVSVQPVLADLPIAGRIVPALIQATKHGQMYILDRRTGKPIFPVTEQAVPQGAVKGDWTSPTQPFSSLPNVIGDRLTERDMWGSTPIDQLWCRIAFKQSRYEGPFTPITTKPTIVQPGFAGGTEWGSVTYDRDRKLVVYLSTHLVNLNQLIARPQANGDGIVPADDVQKIDWTYVAQGGISYAAKSPPFLAFTGTPCQKPPYGRINAMDPTTGKLVWSKPLGTAKGTGPFGIKSHLPLTIGTPVFGGAITTASGLTFVAASLDSTIRAFESKTGKLLWSAALPNDAGATPSTYTTKDGRQYLVIAIGDSETVAPETKVVKKAKRMDASTAGATIVAYALPR